MRFSFSEQLPNERFTIFGKTYNSFKELFPIKKVGDFSEWWERSYFDGFPITQQVLKVVNANFENTHLKGWEIFYDRFSNLILRKEELYPCFDSSDRMYENRYYRLYIFCKNEDDLRNKIAWIKKNGCNIYSKDYLPQNLAPMAYLDDGLHSVVLIEIE